MVSEDQLDFAAFIVYLRRKGAGASEELRSLCVDHSELVLQYVEEVDMRGARPEWLKGVPTVVKLPSYEVFTGTGALHAVKTWAAARPKPVGMPPASSMGVKLTLSEQIIDNPDEPVVSKFSSLEELLREREALTQSLQKRRPSPAASTQK